MIRRILCFLTATVMILLPWAAPAVEEDEEECLHLHWEVRNSKPADVGVPGYSGDKYCLDCHRIFERGRNTLPLEPNKGEDLANQINKDNELLQGGGNGQQKVNDPPEQQQQQQEQQAPKQGQPVQQQNQTQPASDAQPQTEQPVQQPQQEPQQSQAAEPEEPVIPAGEPLPPAQPHPDLPSEPAEPAGPMKETQPEEEDAQPAVIPESAPQEDPEAPDPENTNPADGNPSRNTKRVRFSDTWPFRRVRMTPEPGILAEAAGIRIWPGTASPLQQMIGK